MAKVGSPAQAKASRERLTAGRIRSFACGADARQAFLWDSETPGLAVRATAGSNKKAFVFQSKLSGKSLRITIGDVRAWGIDEARTEARRLQTLIDQGIDPREKRRQDDEQREQAKQHAERAEVLASDAWAAYVAARTSKWSARHLLDHQKLTHAGGEDRKRPWKNGPKKTQAGVLVSLLSCRLADLTAERVARWLAEEVERRPTQAALAFRLLRAFIRWCAEREDYACIVHADACAKRDVREQVPAPRAKQDVLLREQLPAWFKEVRTIRTPAIAAYLQALLLTGARREELAGVRWVDVDFRWKRLTIRDKEATKQHGEGEGFRIIPLTPYVAALLDALPRRNEWVFSSPTAASGRLADPYDAHVRACRAAGIEGLSLHGLRRSFGSLAEWVEIPAGIVAQIQGHRPSATTEKHYRVRPVDLLGVWHNKYEAWILEQAEIAFDAKSDAAPLRLVGE